ncbi:MAG TPA: isochorismate synthase [Polyangiaceae bacterium]|jgi:isochorismate synthase|nr:isochorismate synthase [Polyangiaceae bacterium]
MMGGDVASNLAIAAPDPGASSWELASLREAIKRKARASTGKYLVLSLPAPVLPLSTVFGLARETPHFLWQPSDHAPGVVGFGSVVSLSAQGAERFERIKAEAEALWAGLDVLSLAPPLVPPRLFGGFSFEPGSASGAIWSAFGDAQFVLPRLRYCTAAGRAELSLALTRTEVLADCDPWLTQLLRLHETLARLAADETAPHSVKAIAAIAEGSASSEASTPSAWETQIADILAAIRGNQCSKVVLARQQQVTFEAPLSAVATLASLQENVGAEATCFAFNFGEGTFIGATPETLIHKHALAVSSEALAGSVRADDTDGEQALLDSEKDQGEHRVVVQTIADTLAPLCADLSFDETPKIRRLRHLLHLQTPISGTLKTPLHVLDLVARLHPTPAVAGAPTSFAVRWIAEHEQAPRGWYASPIGWMDATGDGSFEVALRSGVLCGNRAFLYAGAGVVAGSDAQSEHLETEIKLASLRGALRTT